MTTLIECDYCGKQASLETKETIPDWIHDSDYDMDFCSLDCKSKWSESNEVEL